MARATDERAGAALHPAESGDYFHDASGKLFYVVEVVEPEGTDPRNMVDPDEFNVLLEDCKSMKADVFKMRDVMKLTKVERG